MDIELAQALEENKMLSKHILELQNDKGELVDEVKSLKEQIEQLVYLHKEDVSTIKLLNKQIEKLIDFVLSKTECCDVCPITDTCNNSEGTCPYAGILSKGEEAVNREWIMQKIAKEIKEK